MKYQYIISFTSVILFIILLYSYLIHESIFIRPVNAINMDSSSYSIKFGTINIQGGNKSSPSYRLSDTVGQLAANEFSSAGYIVKAGFQYIHSIVPFSFTISNTIINLGTLVPGSTNGSTATTNLTVSFGGAGQYQVTAIEEGKLRILSGAANISDTACDNGLCTVSSAQPWTSSSINGFGYGMTGQDIPADFTDGTYYRPFPDRESAGTPSVVMSSVNLGKARQSTLKFKVNIPSTQTAGSYQTIINFVATPSY